MQHVVIIFIEAARTMQYFSGLFFFLCSPFENEIWNGR
jgi:hypothetical protein